MRRLPRRSLQGHTVCRSRRVPCSAQPQSDSDIGITTPYLYVSQGAAVSVPVSARALSDGMPRSNVEVNFSVGQGTGSLSAQSAQTNASGYATVTLSILNTLSIPNMTGLVQVSACVAPANSPCSVLFATQWRLCSRNWSRFLARDKSPPAKRFSPSSSG